MRETERQREERRTDSEMATLSSLQDGSKDSKMLGISFCAEHD